MARLLYPRDSVPFINCAARRHLRLCRKNAGGELFIKALTPANNLFLEKQAVNKSLSEACEGAYDDIMVADRDLDNQIRTAFEGIRQFDRDSAAKPLLGQIFPNGVYSDIVRMPYADEPNEADQFATRIENLGTTHSFYPLAAALRAKTKQVRDSIEAYNAAIRNEKASEAELEIAKGTLIRQYEYNYLDARRALGVINAEKLFPALTSRSNAEKEVEEATSTADAGK